MGHLQVLLVTLLIIELQRMIFFEYFLSLYEC
jgi:hypothetical protein